MNFNIYLDSALGQALQRLAKRRKVTRNALIRMAVEDLINVETHSHGLVERGDAMERRSGILRPSRRIESGCASPHRTL